MKAVIVGNGPSLKEHLRLGHFDMLTERDIHSFGMNLIDMLYDPDPKYDLPGTDWRPTYWVWAEYVGYSREKQPMTRMEYYDRVFEKHILPKKEKCFIGYRFKKALEKRAHVCSYGKLPRMRAPEDHLIWFERCGSWHGVQLEAHKKPTDWHLPTPCVYGGTMNTVLSFAFMFGYSDVGVLGCDLGIEEPSETKDFNHFHPEYFTFLDGSFEKQDDTLREVHEIAKKNFDRMGRRLVNVGIDGKLDVHPRMEFERWIDD